MPFNFSEGDEVTVHTDGKLLKGAIGRTSVHGDRYALSGAPTTFYPEEKITLREHAPNLREKPLPSTFFPKAQQYGGSRRRNRRRRQNKKYSRRR